MEFCFIAIFAIAFLVHTHFIQSILLPAAKKMERISLILCIVAIFIDTCTGATTNEDKNLDYRLNADIVPIDYVIDVKPYFDTFKGVCTITIKTTKANVNAITLHKQNLNITAQRLTQANPPTSRNIEITSSDYSEKTAKYTLNLRSSLISNREYVLKFDYIGAMNDDGRGFFRESYQDGSATK